MAWLTGYSYRKKITIDQTKVDADLVDFPVLVKLTSTNFDFAKALSTGYDIRFTGSDGTTLLKYERERHDSTGKLAEYFVKIPSVSKDNDTVFRLLYGRSGALDGSDKTEVWGDEVKAMWHMKDDPDTSHIKDSTINANNGTKKGANEPIEADGKVEKAQSFDGTDDYINVPDSDSISIIGDITIEACINVTDFANYREIVGKVATGTSKPAPYDYYLVPSTGNPRFLRGDGSVYAEVSGTSAPSTGAWQYLAVTMAGDDSKSLS